ncbi:MAG: ERCC4 domain-containing protein [Candidatus Anstonellales archaeon]
MSKTPKVICDSREDPELIEFIRDRADVEVRQLSIGDFIIGEVAIERKTRQDFEASVIDGRLFRQLAEMKNAYKKCILIIEGETSSSILKREALLGAYSSIVADFSIPLIFTRDRISTADFLIAVAKHELRGRHIPRIAEKRALTVSESAVASLEQAPMIGPKMARSLLLHFGSLHSIVNAPEDELAKVDGIGPKRAKAIFRFFRANYLKEEDRYIGEADDS